MAIGPIGEVVVTIPANFAHEAREATMAAAKAAGLNVKYIINEPTAAALYYAFQSGKEMSGMYAVYDLGDGTFDVSIIRVDGHNVDVVATKITPTTCCPASTVFRAVGMNGRLAANAWRRPGLQSPCAVVRYGLLRVGLVGPSVKGIVRCVRCPTGRAL